MGRPKSMNPLTERVMVRLTVQQREKLENLAKRSKLKVSDYLRLLILKARRF